MLRSGRACRLTVLSPLGRDVAMSISAESSDAADTDETTSTASTLANGQRVITCHPEQRFDLDPADVVNPALRGTPEDGRLRVVFDALHAQLCDQFNYLPAEV